ncbi:hypothetical protein [Porphyrobacter sp. YT40]|uniref:hypothetical protein n=1 Tax=Porphyrobacter sp. YT40 TaxID=2547601 RepID=UPI001143EDB5|nr:hypothetical protein [Porphyrobacter sp. YT40]QDH34579.1 hypothetical protein E2E27_09725 [Porphyrobacter sp. YT40]
MAYIPPAPPPGERPRQDQWPLGEPGDRAFVAAWLAHVEAGRIGGNPPMSEESRAAVLANERVLCGRQRSLLG